MTVGNEVGAAKGGGTAKARGEPRVLGLYHINVNCSDLERSRRFYELFGFRTLDRFNEKNNANLDRGLGLPPNGGSETLAVFMGVGEGAHSTVIDLCQWLTPPEEAGRALRPTQVGIPRICLRVKHIDALVERLRAQGVTFITDEPMCLTTLARQPRFIVCRDPDGILVELVEL